jgi:Ca2+/Na+ antiporter
MLRILSVATLVIVFATIDNRLLKVVLDLLLLLGFIAYVVDYVWGPQKLTENEKQAIDARLAMSAEERQIAAFGAPLPRPVQR